MSSLPLKLSRLALAALSLASALQAHAAGTDGFYRQPALQGEQVVFVAEGDLWRVGTQGGEAQRLTTHPGYETAPALSPDGRWLAFVGQYDGTTARDGGDVYLMPVSGGVPRRLSWDGAGVRVWGFSAQGELVITAPTQSGQPGGTLYALDIKTGQRRALPVAQASDGALSADGKRLYFTRAGLALHNDNAKQYRGGAIARLWVLDLEGTAEARPLLAEGNNDRRPMPYAAANGEARIAFLSDRDGTVNIWSVNAGGQDLRQHTHLHGWDIRQASIDGTRVAYGVGADIHMLELASDADRTLAIKLGGDFDQQRERFIAKPQDYLKQVAMAPDGERVLLNSRGHLATQGVGTLRRAELPQPADGRCRQGEFSSDSKSVFALCDFGGEVEVWRFPANGLGKPEVVTSGATTLRTALFPSPDGRQLAHVDKEGRLYLTDLLAKGGAATREIARDRIGDGATGLVWSPDGKALAFVQPTLDSTRQQLHLYTLADSRLQVLTSDRYDNAGPAFSPDGQWLYFLSRRDFSITGEAAPWGDRNMGPYFDRGTKIYALALQAGLRFPFAPPDELATPPAEAKADEGKKAGKDAGKDGAKPATPALPAIVSEGLARRLYEVPLPAGNYSELRATAKRLWFLDTEVTSKRKTGLMSLAIGNEPDNKPVSLSGDVRHFALSADGKKLMVERGDEGKTTDVLLVETAPKLPGELDNSKVKWSDWQIATEPRAEWREMFADAWRMHRDFFYDKRMHGVDWNAMRSKYAPLVDRVTDRAELSEVLGMLSSELGALHSQIGTPDLRNGAADPALAGLGAQLSAQAGGWRIERIYQGDPELPDGLSPLAAPGLEIRAGDLVTAVNGRPVTAVGNIAELLRGQAGRQVLLQVKGADGKQQQKIVLPVPLTREQQLRYGDWRYSRALAVQKAGNGRIGYLHLRAMGKADLEDFAREFYAQIDREGLIIDVRYNNGGSIESRILEKLMRRAWAFWQSRSPDGGPAASNMQQTFRGHLVVLANEDTYSDGETFAEGIKRLGLGPLIGKRTSGAGVWLSDQNRLLDNGLARAAESGQMLLDGSFIIEAKGVAPDIEVDNPPRATFQGQDAQLDAAIAEVRKQMAASPLRQPKPASYPRLLQP